MRRASSPGSDGITWRQYRQDLDQRLNILAQKLRDETWDPKDPKKVLRDNFAGKTFLMVVPTVEERIVHRAMRNVIEPILEANAFLDFVSGYRPGRSRITSVRQAMTNFAKGRTVVTDIDITNVSGNVSIDQVIDWLADWISDGSFLRIVKKALLGLPQPICPGSGLSPLLINLRLVPIDWSLKNLNVVRFADNYCVFCYSKSDAQQAFELLCDLLEKHNLSPAPEKSGIRCNVNPEDLFLIAG